MNERQQKEICKRLDIIIKLYAKRMLDDMGICISEQIKFLHKFGFKPKDIAKILGKTKNHVGVVICQEKRRQLACKERRKG